MDQTFPCTKLHVKIFIEETNTKSFGSSKVGRKMANWTFVLPKCKSTTKYINKGLNVAYILGFPNDLVVDHILPCLVFAYNLLLRDVSSDAYSLCDLCCLNREWRWPISFTPKYACFCIIKHDSRSFRGHRHRGCFDHKVLYADNWYLEFFSRYWLFVLPTRLCACWSSHFQGLA